MNQSTDLENSLIIAMPTLVTPLFYHSVIYICEYNQQGAMGIIINRPLDIYLDDILRQMEFDVTNPETQFIPVLCGGPVHMERGFVIHQEGPRWDGSVMLDNGLCITSSREILDDIAHKKGPAQSIVALGYAGWEAGQLEKEISQNAWLHVPCDKHLIFDKPFEERWHAAAQLIGVDIDCVSEQIGHA